MVKKLVAVGCSYTASDWPFPVWPQVLSEKLNLYQDFPVEKN